MGESSAPGKVLILGGYLVTEYPNVGVSIGTTARLNARVLSRKGVTGDICRVRFLSPQFGKEFTFECTVATGPELKLTATQTEGPESPFLCCSVLYTVAAAFAQSRHIWTEITLELLADNDFYSQRNYLESHGQPVTAASLRSLPSHLALVGDVSKTGLGSSAAMTASVVASLYRFLMSNEECEVEKIYRMAQLAHNAAQGKIGSGFDVYTAVYGTSAYRRFPAECMEKVLCGSNAPRSVHIHALFDYINAPHQCVLPEAFRLPAMLQLVLGDVHRGGSGTPGMVSKVMAWRKAVADTPNNLWEMLRGSNEKYYRASRALIQHSQEHKAEYYGAVDVLKHVVLAQHTPRNDAEQLWIEASICAKESRRYLREMGEAAGVGIEPPEITALLDATANIPGVFAVGCPGAGGYDAIFALVLSDGVIAAVEEFWENYKAMHVCPLLVREGAEGLIVS